MSFKKNLVVLAAGSLLLLTGAASFSQTTSSGTTVTSTNTTTNTVTSTATSTATRRLASRYNSFAGSPENANALISGLRDGTPITLQPSPGTTPPTVPPTTFTPATGKLGYGNINIALSLAKADLARQGISNPTPEQLAAALNGGPITTSSGTVTLSGVLAQRAAGQGWGQIANAMGVKLGNLVSASKTDKSDSKPDKFLRSSRAENARDTNAANSQSSHAGGDGNGGGHGGGSSGNGGSHGK